MERLSREWYNAICGEIIGSAIDVHRELGPGLLESVYEVCLVKELKSCGLTVANQVALPIKYKGELLHKDLFIDILVEDSIILELKSVTEVSNIHKAQLHTYLKLSDKKLGYLINFNVHLLKNGIHRYILGSL
ncbi:GxxExxY protein [Bacteroidales bacterium Barb7]|nr:GxxExxY protein [Bacteroidales bacterium Barb7]